MQSPRRWYLAATYRALPALALSLLAAAAPAPAATIYSTYNDGSRLATIDTATGGVTIVGSFGFSGTYGNAFDLDGTMYATPNANKLGAVNLTTGAISILGSLPGSAYAIEVDSQGNLYALLHNGQLHRINKANGSSLEYVGPTGIGSAMDIAFDSNDNLYATVSGHLYRVSTANGSIQSDVVIQGLGSAPMGLMFDANDTLFITEYLSSGRLFTLNPNTGVPSFVAGAYNYPHGGDIYIPAPEPSTLLLAGFGAIALLVGARRQGMPSTESAANARTALHGCARRNADRSP